MKVYMPVWRYMSELKLCTASDVIFPSGNFRTKSLKYWRVPCEPRMNSGDTVGRKVRSEAEYRDAALS
jgi:hypothetical protein